MLKKHTKLLTLLSLILCTIICVIAAFSLLFMPKQSAYAKRGNLFIVVGENEDGSHEDLWKGGNKPFNADVLKELYQTLLKVDTYSAFEKAVNTETDKTFTSADFRDKNEKNNISIWFAGKKWDIVYLTKDRAGTSVVLDLWQSADNLDEDTLWRFSYHCVRGAQTSKYPSNMYSTSKVRVEALNNGGYASRSTTSIPTEPYEPKTTEEENQYARFTSPKAKDNVTAYILKPKDIAYQETENAYGKSQYDYTLVNDAYGRDPDAYDGGEHFYDNSFKNYINKDKYFDWEDDYIWLPSVAEIGGGSTASDIKNKNGLWETNIALRSCVSNWTWLRSGDVAEGNFDYFNGQDGTIFSNYTNYDFVVRPALHLNLTAAAGAASGAVPEKPTDDQLKQEFDYNGTEQAFTMPDFGNVTYTAKGGDTSWWSDADKTINYKNAGEYKVEVTPPADGWKDGSHDSVTFTLKINKAKIGESWQKAFPKSQDFTFSLDLTHEQQLCLPDITDTTKFPLTRIDKTVLAVGDIKIQYIIEPHAEKDHSDDKINERLSHMQDGTDGGVWKDYSPTDKDFKASDPGGYCVYFKADAGDNFEILYSYYSVHIFTEKLTIKLKNPTNHSATFEYGEIAHTQTNLRTQILGDIPQTNGIVILDDDGSSIKEDKTADFITNAANFEFYFRDDSNVEYKVDDSGNMRLAAGKTYYLYVKYLGEAGVAGSEKYITFEWGDSANSQRPSVTISKRKVKLTLSSLGHTYGSAPAAITAVASRDTGNWWGSAAQTAPDIKTELNLTYKARLSSGAGATGGALPTDLEIDSKLNAATYDIIPVCGSSNYEIDVYSGTYTVQKGDYSITYNNLTEMYTGAGIEHEISSLPAGVTATYTYESTDKTTYAATTDAPKNVGTYTVTASFKVTDTNYNTPDDITVNLTIEQLPLTFELKSDTGEYNGAEHTDIDVDFITLITGESLKKGVDYELVFTPDDAGVLLGSSGLPQEKGSYTVKVNLLNTTAANNYVMELTAQDTYTIGIGGLAMPTGNDLSETYTGLLHTLTISGYDKTKMGYTITGDSGAAFDEDSFELTATNAGVYTLTITIDNTNEYKWTGNGKTQFVLTVSKAQLTVTADNKTTEYGTLPTYTVTYSGFVNGESAASLGYTATASSAYAFSDGVGDDFVITVTAPQTLANYNVTTADGTLEVTPKSVSLTISDGGHRYAAAPQALSFGLETPAAGVLVGSDTAAQIAALVTFRLEQNGVVVAHDNPAALVVGVYDICADDGVYGNYNVTFTSGSYTVSKAAVSTPTADKNAENFVYTGEELTYMPEGFDPDTMDIEGNVQTSAGKYTVTVTLKDQNTVFDSGASSVEFEFDIQQAEIIVRKGSNEWFDESFEQGSGEDFKVSFLEKDGDNYKYIVTVDGCEVEVKFDPTLKEEGTAAGSYTASVPPTIPRSTTAGRYVIYYEISDPAGNHATLQGEWRVEIADRSGALAVIFNKRFTASYGMNYNVEQLFKPKSEFADGISYISVYKFEDEQWKEQDLTWFKELVDVTVSKKHSNYFGNQNTGTYDIAFTLKAGHEDEWTIMYKLTNDDYDSNEDQFVIEKAKLQVIWGNLTFEWNEQGDYTISPVLAATSYSEPLELEWDITKDGQTISKISDSGSYLVTARLKDDYGNFEIVNATQIVEVKAAPVKEEDGGLPWWVWLIVGVGAALIITAIIIVIVVMKKKKAKDGGNGGANGAGGNGGFGGAGGSAGGANGAGGNGFESGYGGGSAVNGSANGAGGAGVAATGAASTEPKIIYRDINTDDDGFYDDVESDGGNG